MHETYLNEYLKNLWELWRRPAILFACSDKSYNLQNDNLQKTSIL